MMYAGLHWSVRTKTPAMSCHLENLRLYVYRDVIDTLDVKILDSEGRYVCTLCANYTVIELTLMDVLSQLAET